MQIVETIKELYPKLFVRYLVLDDLRLPPENDLGSVEYKRSLINCDKIRIQKYSTQMLWRITENNRYMATYYVGVSDDGTLFEMEYPELIESINNLVRIAGYINASICRIEILDVNGTIVIRSLVKNKKVKNIYTIDL